MTAKTVTATTDESVAKTAEETTAAQAGTPATETKKVNRRGVASARGTQRLKFTHQLANPGNGLFISHLESVEVSKILIGESTSGLPSFNGLEIPKIVLTFASNEDDPNKRHFVTLQFTAVESNVNTIPGGKEDWKVNTVFDWFKHVLNVFVFKGREMTDEEADSLGLAFEDFDEQGEYIPVEPETVIAAWTSLFENVENLLNRSNDGNPTYKDKNGKPIALWIKLLRHVKTKKGWQNVSNGDLAFPSFVGEGAIEIWKQNMPTSIRVDAVKETIVPMNIEKAKAPNMGGAGIPSMGGMPMGDFSNGGGFGNDIGAAAGDDMPF